MCYNNLTRCAKYMEQYLDQKLIRYGKTDIYPFHMPGHKRRKMGDWSPEEIDITEIDGFDNLHHAEGIIRDGQRRLADISGTDESFYLVNGSTGGLLAAICGAVRKGDRILIARNCHKAVYHAVYLMELRAEYLYPEATESGIQGSISPGLVKEKLEQFPDAAAVVITSPTYDGIVSDIETLAGIVHARGIPLIVDEAHGAHFGFSCGFPEKAVALGADLCIESLHKTLPSYTQTAALHMKKDQGRYRFDPERVKRYLGIFQSSSPSYVFMAGMDRCVRILQKEKERYACEAADTESLFRKFEKRLEEFYEKCRSLEYVRLYPWFSPEDSCEKTERGVWAKDNSKILISAQQAGLNGQELYELLLEKYHLQMEMASGHYVTALTSIMDTEDGFRRLSDALEEIDRTAAEQGMNICRRQDPLTPVELYRPREKRMELAEAMERETREILLEDAAGCISGEFIYLYPPGIPIIAPGEVITGQTVRRIGACRERGMQVQGMRDPEGVKVQIVCFTND